jgi:hypothetical protein
MFHWSFAFTQKNKNQRRKREMKKANKTTATAIVTILMFAISATLFSVPIVQGKTTVTASISWNQFTGVNSETLFIIVFTPNILDNQNIPPGDPNLVGRATIWSDANLTLTRPDGTIDVVRGPFILEPNMISGTGGRLYIYYTPNMKGDWTVNFYYPGDATYNPINRTEPVPMQVIDAIPKRTVWAMLSIKPYPTVGLGQDILINAWLTPPPLTNRQIFSGYVFTFTAPSGNSFTVGPMDSEAPATVWFNLPLTELGNWSIKFEFPGDYASLPASITRYINVVNDWIPSYPDTPMPYDFAWSRPINIQNREWRNIAGMWSQASYNASEGSYNPYTEAPRTAHILWDIPAYANIGGIMGAPRGIETGSGQEEYGAGQAGLFSASVYDCDTILAGRAYSSAGGNITCVDLRTGEILWTQPGSFNYGTVRGRNPVLYSFSSTRFIAYNAIDGSVLNNVTGMSVGFFDNPYAYTMQTNNTEAGNRLIKWDASSTTSNFTARIVWNETNVLPYFTTAHTLIQGNLMISRHFLTSGNQLYEPDYPVNTILVDYLTSVNLTTGKMEWNVTTTNPSDPNVWIYRQGPAWGSGEGLIYFAGFGNINSGLGYVAFDAKTGALKWWSDPTDYPWGNFWAYQPQGSGNGFIYGLSYSGIWAFNATNGKIAWHYINNDTYFEEPYASNIVSSDAYPNNLNLSAGDTYASYSYGSTGPIIGGSAAVGGSVLYAVQSEHSPTFYYRGYGMQGIDAITGQHLFDIKGVYSIGSLAEGTLVVSDSQNGFTYAFAKGSTATTVSPSSKVVAKGDSLLLEGTVLDMSPAQKGTAAVSLSTMEDWMEYLHMQQPYPATGTGVPVSLDALDPNNNYVHLGDATSDLTGKYSFLWTPEIEGKYTIVASFASNDAYYGSTAETAVGVTAAPATSNGGAGGEVTPPTDLTPILYAVIGIGIAIIIAIAVAILLLRKRA